MPRAEGPGNFKFYISSFPKPSPRLNYTSLPQVVSISRTATVTTGIDIRPAQGVGPGDTDRLGGVSPNPVWGHMGHPDRQMGW